MLEPGPTKGGRRNHPLCEDPEQYEQFRRWVRVYHVYLRKYYTYLKSNKDLRTVRSIPFEEFCFFAYQNSSQYLSPYV